MKKIGILVTLLVWALPLSILGVHATESCDDRNPDLSNVIIVDGVTPGTGEYRQYDKIHLKKRDSVSADLQCDNSDEEVSLLDDGRISIDQVSLTPGSHKSYGPYTLKKGDVVSIDVNWEEPGNIYLAIGKEFGNFRGLKTSGWEKTDFNETLKVSADGGYYIFIGIQNTESESIDGLSGEISYHSN